MNFAQARYQSPAQGRFTSPDPFSGSMSIADPQSFNRYAYVGNNPLNATDPTGMELVHSGGSLPGAEGAMGRVHPGEGFDSGTDGSNGQRWMMAGGSEPEEEAYEEATSEQQQGQRENPDAARTNGNAADIRTDQNLTRLFTGDNEDAIVRGASSTRAANEQTGDTHYKLGNGTVHTIHIYGDPSANKIVGIYVPAAFSVIRFVGGDYNTVTATNPRTGQVIGIAHTSVTSQQELNRNIRTTNRAGSRYVANIGGPGGNLRGNIHAHLTLFRSATARQQALAWKTAGRDQLRDFNTGASYWLGDFRRLVK